MITSSNHADADEVRVLREEIATLTRQLTRAQPDRPSSPVNKIRPFEKAQMVRETKRLRALMRRTITPNGKFLRRWDMMRLLAQILTALVTPVEIAFVDGFTWGMCLVNRTVDLIFIGTVVIKFMTPYRESAQQGSKWVYTPHSIWMHYLRDDLWLDVITSLPTDLLLYEAHRGTPSFPWRMVRIVRLLRLAHLDDIVLRYTQTSSIDLSVLELIKFAFYTIIAAHWLACLWGYIGRMKPNDPIDLDTWYVADRTNQSWIQKHQLTTATEIELYSICLYIALSNIFGAAISS